VLTKVRRDGNRGASSPGTILLLRFINLRRIRRASYAPLLATGMGLMMVRLLVMAKLLEVGEFATLSSALILSNLVNTIACFGLFLHLQRMLPIELARHHHRASVVLMSQTIIAAFGVGGIGIVIGASGVSLGGISADMVLLGAIHGLSQQLFLIATTESRSNNETVRYSVQHLLRSIATVLLGIVAAVIVGSASAVLIAEAAIAFISVATILSTAGRRFNVAPLKALVLGIRSFRRVDWVSMFALLAYSVVVAMSVQLDRWLSSAVLPIQEFASYSFAWIAMIAALSAQALVNASIYPMIARRFALSGRKAAYRLTFLISFGMLAACLVPAVICVFVADFLIARYYPAYLDATALVPILALAAIFRISDFWSSFLIIDGKERSTLVATTLSLLGTVAVWYFAIGGQFSPVHLAYLAAAISAVTYVIPFTLSWHARA
jgi:O-antigen/teichoic acid export membrane protein